MAFRQALFVTVYLLPFALVHSSDQIYLKPHSNIYLPYAYDPDGITGLYGIDKAAVEQSAYDRSTGIVYAAGASYIHIVDYNNVTNPVIIDKIPTYSRPITDAEQCGSKVAFTVEALTPDQPGEVHVYHVYNKITGEFKMAYMPFAVGFGPDMLQFTPNCDTIIVANEASPYETQQRVIDPEGSVSIIKFGDQNSVSTIDFKSFNQRADEYVMKGVRWHYKGQLGTPGTFSQSLEPEFVTLNGNGTKAYITLQENNAIAEVNLETETIDEIYSLGVKDWNRLLLDSSDADQGINFQSYDMSSLRMPDSARFLAFKGNGYIITADEGDTLELELPDGRQWTDVKRGRRLLEENHLSSDIDQSLRTALADDSILGRLQFSIIDGLSETEANKISRLHFPGSRGISVFRAEGMSLLWDSGNLVETIHAKDYASTFNGNTKPDDPAKESPSDLKDTRSDDQGPECESLAIGELDDGTRLVFVGVDRSSSILIFSVDEVGAEPRLEFQSILRDGGVDDTFNVLLENRNLGNLDPEDLRFIPAAFSPTNKPLLLVTSAVSGTLAMYEVVKDTGPGSGGESIHTWNVVILSMWLMWLIIARQ